MALVVMMVMVDADGEAHVLYVLARSPAENKHLAA